jgi:HEPN domain-containing protein
MMMKEYYANSIEEAEQYLKAAVGGLKREAVFTPEILYNILGMAIEQYCLALLYYKGKMPDNHTFLDLVEAVGMEVHVPEDLKKELIDLQAYQEICCLDAYVRKVPDRTAILGMIDTTRKLESFVKTACA